ncbi:hypothetical protein GCM10011316_05340 [Roseibium aquae]|uniref:NUDIX hydrolase n=1 Tax=Roseibium aquae TaxID=1323746 RepID=A0A916T8X5_9HYPH|nr:GNAT family N-acetyltransferase [Roseibium aquae]GGB36123.1 hypothetical protein GCM10011316_05340 [Roseibium aquae]
MTARQIGDQHVLVAERDGAPVGYLAAEKQDEDTLLVEHLFVCPGSWGKGVGRLLLTRAQDHARGLGLGRLRLQGDVPAQAFFESQGFEPVGAKPSKLLPGQSVPRLEKTLGQAVYALKRISLAKTERPWAFEAANAAEIDAYFAGLQKQNPALWNGRTLKLVAFSFEDGVFTGTCAETSFAAFLAWRDWGAPDLSSRNLFGSAVIRSRDGALLYGRMSASTANPGLIYPPGGGLDLDDVRPDGSIDIERSLLRELAEETGLAAAEVSPGDAYIVFDGPRIACARVLNVDADAVPLRERIMRFSISTHEQELSEVRIMRHPRDLQDRDVVPFARVLGEALLKQQNL